MARGLILVLDSVGCGGAEDAAAYGDAGADTLGHLAAACAEGRGDRSGLRSGPLNVPNLDALGLGLAMHASTGAKPPGFACRTPRGQWGFAVETSRGKDTPSGHWEIAGTPVAFDWGYFPIQLPAFPESLMQAMIEQGGLTGTLGNCHASGTQIIEDFGEEHLRTLKPICYTSADSVFQIAAHEEAFGLQRLYDLCKLARKLVDPLNIGRVIARPFLGRTAADFARTSNRKDYSIPPLAGNLMERAAAARREIISIGKIGDIFAHAPPGKEWKGKSNADHIDLTIKALNEIGDGGFVFTNLVDFDTEYGHRRDIAGFAACLEGFDARLPAIQAAMRPGDFAVISADHGNDPTWRGYDHTREHAPIIAFGPDFAPGPVGARKSMADIGETMAQVLGLPGGTTGRSWLA